MFLPRPTCPLPFCPFLVLQGGDAAVPGNGDTASDPGMPVAEQADPPASTIAPAPAQPLSKRAKKRARARADVHTLKTLD